MFGQAASTTSSLDKTYTIIGHAYRSWDSGKDDWITAPFQPTNDFNKYVEIFHGQTNHTVLTGLNQLSLRLSPLLDTRELTLPRITHLYRPYEMDNGNQKSITVKGDNVSSIPSAIPDDINYRYRSVDPYTFAKKNTV